MSVIAIAVSENCHNFEQPSYATEAGRLLDAGSQLVWILPTRLTAPEWLHENDSRVTISSAHSLADFWFQDPVREQVTRFEFWGSRSGFYTADVELVPAARLLLEVDYIQAQELARLGQSDLRASDLESLRIRNLPLHVTRLDIAGPGTWIQPRANTSAEVSAVVCQPGIHLISIDSAAMWQQSGFLAAAFAVFARHNLSVDTVATSQTNLTVTLDGPVAEAALQALLNDLPGEVHLMSNCTAVTLVGRRIRTLIPKLGPALELFDEQKIHLLTQASSDVSLSLLVDADQAPRLVRELHQLLFSQAEEPARLGPAANVSGRPVDAHEPAWWTAKRERLLELARADSPLYVYDSSTITERLRDLQSFQSVDRVFFAIKANNNAEVLTLLHRHKVALECVSQGEIEHALQVIQTSGSDSRVLFTPNFAPVEEYAFAFGKNAIVTLDSLSPLEQQPEIFAEREVFLRLDSGQGDGHHKHVRTGGNASKFGISRHEFATLQPLLHKHRVRVTGLHCHQGSGIMNAQNWAEVAGFLSATAGEFFPDVRVLDLGGGLGVPERRGKDHLNLTQVDQSLQHFKALHPQFELWLEPGRFLVAESGVLLTRVTQVKTKGSKTFVGLDTGFNSLIRPALYGSYHEIVNLSRLDEKPSIKADVVGPICETGDVLGRDRWLPPTAPGDVFLIGTAGAYGKVMASTYNLRRPAREYVLQELGKVAIGRPS
jgi:diaminopimelate decarboxylase/aspartate kinase